MRTRAVRRTMCLNSKVSIARERNEASLPVPLSKVWELAYLGQARQVNGLLFTLVFAIQVGISPSVFGQTEKQLGIELNALGQSVRGCRVSFVIVNRIGVQVDSALMEIALFDKQQRLTKLLSLRSGRLPKSKTRVKQFELTGIKCNDLGGVLLNDIPDCKGNELTPQDCVDLAKPTSRINVPFRY